MEITVYELNNNGNVKQIREIPNGIMLSCAFGCFDGVHIGHQALIRAACENAKMINRELTTLDANTKSGKDAVILEKSATAEPAIWTFSEPVSKPWILPIKKRLSLCGQHGIKYAICQRFEDVRELSPSEFIDTLEKKATVCHGVCGFNFRFGKNRTGDPSVLAEELRKHTGKDEKLSEFLNAIGALRHPVTVIDEVKAAGGTVSSTRIRKAVADGDVQTASELLGRPYSLEGEILHGNRLGRTYSRPTANLRYSKDQLIPKRGVYFTECTVGKNVYDSVTNVGSRPTVNEDGSDVTCEVHILNFDRAVYGETAEVKFLQYSRPEIRFEEIGKLAERIGTDVAEAEDYFAKRRRK